MLVVGESSNTLDLTTGDGKSAENSTDISARLHRNDSKLILLIDPDEESLLIVVEDASALGPVSVKVASFEETITLLEEEVVSNELVSLSIGH